mgnify:CR=1 FL=1
MTLEELLAKQEIAELRLGAAETGRSSLTAAIERLSRQVAPEQASLLRLRQALAALSAREREVLDQLLQGHYNKNIADHLGITQRTVEFHRANIFEKLQVHSAVELAHLMGRFADQPS